MAVTIWGAFARREESAEFFMNMPDGLKEYILLHFYNPVEILAGGALLTTKPHAWILYTPGTAQQYKSAAQPFVNDYIKFQPGEEGDPRRFGIPVNEIFYLEENSEINLYYAIDRITWMLTDRSGEHASRIRETFLYVLSDIQTHIIAAKPKQRRDDLIRDKLVQLRNAVKSAPTDWTVAAMAQHCYFSRSYFSALYKKQFGRAPKDELADFTMEYSKQLLAQTDRMIAEISETCGYTCPENFSRAFKAQFGVTPLFFRSQRAEVRGWNRK
ncbi:MAG: helix-turn-helix transcriptional regulator [Oscillospiraceae bacterium]